MQVSADNARDALLPRRGPETVETGGGPKGPHELEEPGEPGEVGDGGLGRRRFVCGLEAGVLAWLVVFCISGVGLGLCYEFLELHSLHHAPGAAADTFFLCLIGYVSQALVSGAFAFSRPNPLQGSWTKPALVMLVLSSVFDGLAQGLDFFGQSRGGYILFTIFHSSVTLFSCIIAVFVVQAKVTRPQWGGILLVIVGLLATAFPNPIASPGSFWVGMTCSLVGSFFLAASYPFSEKVFRLSAAGPLGPVKEETACFFGALVNTFFFVVWTCVYTIPRWDSEINAYIKPGQGGMVAVGFCLYGVLVGVHSLSFWKSVNKLGTVPTAVAKGAQQAGVFLASHVVFCGIDEGECLWYNHGKSAWNKMQKSVAAMLCVAGVVVYALNKNKNQQQRQGS
jgi:drug/metabolite transporter (DMT)-like permease